jgi:hypothetical protein
MLLDREKSHPILINEYGCSGSFKRLFFKEGRYIKRIQAILYPLV